MTGTGLRAGPRDLLGSTDAVSRYMCNSIRHVFASNHIVAGAAIGFANRRRPLSAFAMGFASHLAMDSLPHWGEVGRKEFIRAARFDGLSALALAATCTWAAPRNYRPAVLAGMAGALLPDLDKPAKHLLGIRLWPHKFNYFHGWIQRNRQKPWRARHEMAICAAGLATTVALSAIARDRAPDK